MIKFRLRQQVSFRLALQIVRSYSFRADFDIPDVVPLVASFIFVSNNVLLFISLSNVQLPQRLTRGQQLIGDLGKFTCIVLGTCWSSKRVQDKLQSI